MVARMYVVTFSHTYTLADMCTYMHALTQIHTHADTTHAQ